MFKGLRRLAVGLVFMAALPVHANALDQLASLLTGYERFSARFEQFSSGEQGARGEVTSGYLAVSRPDKFVWNTETPFPQEIVSDGEYIWIYDTDLEQATRKSADQNTESAPALILNGRIHELDRMYEVTLLQRSVDMEVFELIPKLPQEAMFSRIRLLFKDAVLSEFLLDDTLGQRSTIMLSEVQLNPELDDSIFSFTPPDDIDVLYESEL